MPTYSADPQDDDLQAFLTAAKVWDDRYSALLPGYPAAAVERFEELTGRRPYLAGAPTTLLFDPQGPPSSSPFGYRGGERRLELDVPFTSVTAIALGVTPDSPGQPMEIGRNAWLRPDRREIKGLPVEWIEFAAPVWGPPRSISVTGTPGSVSAWPADVWNAVLAGAAADLASDAISTGILTTPGVTSWKESDAGESYDSDGALAGNVAMWRARFDQAVRRKRLVRLGL